ncbi:MAG: EamA family transporter [Anaerolineae bacterium]|nr:EamA family transporter [Anaerolineae bacterium]
MSQGNVKAWTGFWLLGMIWGSSFLFIRISITGSGLFSGSGGGGFTTFEIVFIRTLLGALGLAALVFKGGHPLPRDRHTLGALLFIGLGNVVLPFLLITWSEQFISSGMAAVLQASAALFGLVVAHFLFADDRITPRKIVGLITGFGGVLLLFQGNLGGQQSLAGMTAMVLASLCYAVFTSWGRKLIQRNMPPVLLATATMVVGALVTGPMALFHGLTPLQDISADAWTAVLTLGLLNTFVAYSIYYFLVRELGVARTTMVTYVIPAVGVALGALLLAEEVGLVLLTGGALILAGIAIVNLRTRRLPARLQQGSGFVQTNRQACPPNRDRAP